MAMGGWRSWLSLVGVIWLQSINGTNTNLAAYSSELKQQLSLSQLQLNNLALASDAGKLFGWCAGMAAIHLPLWVVLLIGSSLSLIGYGVQYLFLIHQIPSLSYWHLFLVTLVAGNGICWINTVCYLVIIHNFPHHRQAAVGLTTSYLGLSAVIYTAIVGALFSSPSKTAQGYMLMNAVLPLATSIITAPFVRYYYFNTAGKPTKKLDAGFLLLLLITTATGVYSVASSLLRSPSASPWIKVLGIGACLITPLLIPLAHSVGDALDHKFLLDNRERRVCDLEITTTTTTIDHHHHDADGGGGVAVEEGVAKEDKVDIAVHMEEKQVTCSGSASANAIEDIGVRSMLKRLNFWLYLLTYLFGATLGLVYMNNLGQIAESRGYSSSRTSSLVSLASAFMFFGRLLPSIQDYIYSSRKGKSGKTKVTGPASIAAVMVPMAGAFFLLVKGSSSLCLQMSTGIIGLGIGVITTISVSTTSELFGPNNFGVNHNVVIANIPLGSFLFGDLAAFVYHSNTQGGQARCLGLECYRITFLTWAFLCSFGSLLGLLLHLRTHAPPSIPQPTAN